MTNEIFITFKVLLIFSTAFSVDFMDTQNTAFRGFYFNSVCWAFLCRHLKLLRVEVAAYGQRKHYANENLIDFWWFRRVFLVESSIVIECFVGWFGGEVSVWFRFWISKLGLVSHTFCVQPPFTSPQSQKAHQNLQFCIRRRFQQSFGLQNNRRQSIW